MNPYKILDLNKDFTVEQLRTNYKKIALQVHPDKSHLGSDYLFKLVTLSYKTLLKEWEKRQSDKQFNQLRGDSQSYREEQARTRNGGGGSSSTSSRSGGGLSIGVGNGFNSDRFNQVFDENKLDDSSDVGYGDWMTQSSAKREEININNNVGKYNIDRFNKTFESQPVDKQRKIVVYKEPEAIFSNKKMGFAELGVTNISDFSGDNLTNKSLNYSDYKIAHTTDRLVDPRAVKQRKDYTSIKDLEADRSRISYKLSEKELRSQARKQAKEQELERQRLEQISKRDKLVMKQYEQLNRLLLGK
jgi:curved DNA-binding protein CbpA